MGYMGFGMRKEVYTRKPKRAFEKIKKAYEQEIKKSASKSLVLKNDKIDEDLKQRIRKKIRRQERTRIAIVITTTLIITIVAGILLHYLAESLMIKSNILHPSKKVDVLFNRKLFKNRKTAIRAQAHGTTAGS